MPRERDEPRLQSSLASPFRFGPSLTSPLRAVDAWPLEGTRCEVPGARWGAMSRSLPWRVEESGEVAVALRRSRSYLSESLGQ